MKKNFQKGLAVLACFLIGVFVISCSDSDPEVITHDPNKPITLEKFLPEEGLIREKFIIKGDNFGSDPEKVKVFFGEREAMVLNVNNTTVYCIVPKQDDGYSTVKVEVEGKAVEFSDKQFRYHVQASISTLVGKAKDPGATNGTIAETTLTTPRYIAIDDQDNLYINEAGSYRLRLVSLSANKSITLYEKALFGKMSFIDDEQNMLFALGDEDRKAYLFDARTNWTPEPIGQVATSGNIHSVVSQDEDHIIFRINNGSLMAAPFDGKKGMKPENSVYLGHMSQYAGGQNGHLVYNPHDGYIYCSTHRDHVIWRIKVGPEYSEETTVIEPLISNGIGNTDGGFEDAKFNSPKGMAVDSEGNLYVADENNHRIRKIDLKNRIVTTVAGSVEGYEDGEPLEARLTKPTDVYVDRNDFIYIADGGNNCVRKLAIE